MSFPIDVVLEISKVDSITEDGLQQKVKVHLTVWGRGMQEFEVCCHGSV